MKVVCIDDKDAGLRLTIDKIYDIIDIETDWYVIKDNFNVISRFYTIRFKSLSEIRNETIDKILEE